MANAAAGPTTTIAQTAPAARRDARWRWLALVGAALAFYAAWVSWGIGLNMGPPIEPAAPPCYYFPNLAPTGLSCFSSATNANPLFDPTLLAWVTPLGLLFVPLLWSRRFRVLAASLFVLWWLYMTITLLAAALVILPLLAQGQAVITLTNTTPRVGLLAALLGLALGWIAVVPLVRDALRQVRGQGWASALPRAPRRMVPQDATPAVRAHAGLLSGGAGAVSAGVVLWGVSLVVLPWALGSCPASVHPGGTCAGLTAGAAMWAGSLPAVAWINPLVFQVALPVLLAGGALLALYAVWRLPVNGRLCGWLAVWLAAATGALALGMIGVGEVLSGALPALVNATPYSGYVVGEVGLAFGWLGLVPLVLAALSRRAETSAG